MNFGWCNCVTIYILFGQKWHHMPDSSPVLSYDIPRTHLSRASPLDYETGDESDHMQVAPGIPVTIRFFSSYTARGVPREGSQGFQNLPKQNQLLSAAIEKEAPNAKKTTLSSLCRTRWIEWHKAYDEIFFDMIPSIVKTLEAISHK